MSSPLMVGSLSSITTSTHLPNLQNWKQDEERVWMCSLILVSNESGEVFYPEVKYSCIIHREALIRLNDVIHDISLKCQSSNRRQKPAVTWNTQTHKLNEVWIKHLKSFEWGSYCMLKKSEIIFVEIYNIVVLTYSNWNSMFLKGLKDWIMSK